MVRWLVEALIRPWWPGWDYLIEGAKGWVAPYIADAYLLFLVLLLVFEIIERDARRKKQRSVADATTSKQRQQVGGRRRTSQLQTKFQTKKNRSL
jgi:hypothetical protein